MLIPEVPGIFSSYYVESHTNYVQIVSLYKDSQFVHNLYEMPYRSNKSPLCGLIPTSMHSYMHRSGISIIFFLSQVWEEEVSLIGLVPSGSQPFI